MLKSSLNLNGILKTLANEMLAVCGRGCFPFLQCRNKLYWVLFVGLFIDNHALTHLQNSLESRTARVK